MQFIKVRIGLNEHDGKLNIVQSGVLFWLLRHADPLSGSLRTSATAIASNTSSNHQQVQRALRALELGGYISRKRLHSGQKGDYLIQINKYETIDGRSVNCDSDQKESPMRTMSAKQRKSQSRNPSDTHRRTHRDTQAEVISAVVPSTSETKKSVSETHRDTHFLTQAKPKRYPSDTHPTKKPIYNDSSINEILDLDKDKEKKEEEIKGSATASPEVSECIESFRKTFSVITEDMENAFQEDLQKYGVPRMMNALKATMRKSRRSYRYTRKVAEDSHPISTGELIRSPSEIYEATFHKLRPIDAQRFDEKLVRVPHMLLERVCRKKVKGYRERLKELQRWIPGPEPEDLKTSCESICNDCLRQRDSMSCGPLCPFKRR